MRLIDADELHELVNWTTLKSPFSRVQVKKWIDTARTVDAVPVRHGEWTRHVLGSTGYGTTVMHQCSECERMAISRFRYCPNCGAMMDERKEE